MTAAHHRDPTFRRLSARIRAQANADPMTTCWRCGRTLDQCPPHRDGTPAKWTAGHVVDGTLAGGLLAECSPCNFGAGATTGNTRRAVRRNPEAGRW